MPSSAQRFSLLVEGGPLRGQVDGDKLDGFNYRGFTAGIGSNVTLTNEHFISIKTSYYSQGSKQEEPGLSDMSKRLQIATELQTIGLELSYKYRPLEKFYILGLGVVRHQVANVEYEVFSKPMIVFEEDKTLGPRQLKSGFTSLKLYAGFRAFSRGEVYFSVEGSMTNLLNSDFLEFESLVPYSLAVVFTYEIISPKEVKTRSRPGSKVRPPRSN
jgi:hypothetical protein